MNIPKEIVQVTSLLFSSLTTWRYYIKLVPRNNHITYETYLLSYYNSQLVAQYRLIKEGTKSIFNELPAFGHLLSNKIPIENLYDEPVDIDSAMSILNVEYPEYKIFIAEDVFFEPPKWLLPFYQISNTSNLYPLILESSICSIYSSPLDFILGGLLCDEYKGSSIIVRSLFGGDKVDILVDNEPVPTPESLINLIKKYELVGSFSFNISQQASSEPYNKVIDLTLKY
jgi:hypothetical protein